jgi:hypothetical protein
MFNDWYRHLIAETEHAVLLYQSWDSEVLTKNHRKQPNCAAAGEMEMNSGLPCNRILCSLTK